MTAEQLAKIEWLGRYEKAEEEVERYREIYVTKKSALISAKGFKKGVSTEVRHNIIEEKYVEMITAEHNFNDSCEYASILAEEIEQAIREVPDFQCRLLLRLHYLQFKGISEIAKILAVSRSTAVRLHNKSLILLKIGTLNY